MHARLSANTRTPASPRPVRSRRLPRLGTAALLAWLPGCDGIQSALQPDGPDAAAIAELYWVLAAIATLVSLVVIGLVVYALFRRREISGEEPPLPLTPRSEKQKRERLQRVQEGEAEPTASDADPLPVQLHTGATDRRAIRWVMLAGAAIPTVILICAFVFTERTHGLVDRREEPVALTVEVIGRRWWWEVHYLDAQGRRLFETANEIHIPAGERVRFRLKSADVIHSFWVPQLGGKLDMIPGRVNQFSLQADRAGVYRGQCAEYCAGPHAMMSMLVIAQPRAEFQAWMAHQALGEPPLADPLARAGREVFLNTACSACHAVRGTPAVGDLGPDLTHVASRRTLAAVTIPNTKGHLGGWLGNPQRIKPDNLMPAVPMESEHFLALLHYMQSLR
jgi:cytochrome c oxidase subunit 2